MDGCRLARAAALAAAALVFGHAHAQAAPLVVEVAADSSFSRSFDWDLDKSVVPESVDRFIGESQELEYTIAVTRGEAVDSDFRVSGQATIGNPNSEPATIASITILLGSSIVAHPCSAGTLAGGAVLTCPFDVSVSSGVAQNLSVDVQTSGAIAGASDSMGVVFEDPVVGGSSIQVTDSNLPGQTLTFDGSGTHVYTHTAQCLNGNSVVIDNTATVVGTGQSDTEQARVACHTLRMERHAFPGGASAWNWDIAKTHAEAQPLSLFAGQTYDVHYTITATATASGGDGSQVTGTVVILNTHPLADAQLVSVDALIDGTFAATVECPSLLVPDAEYDAASNVIYGRLVCPFSVAIPSGHTPELITGNIVQQVFAHAADGSATPAGTHLLTGTSGVGTGSGGGEETDECIAIEDLYQGTTHDLGVFCAGDSPVVLDFVGSIEVTGDSECAFEVPNLARFVTNDTGAEGEDATLVSVVRTDCEGGCTRTQGYWKTHSIYGPAPYDDTWAAIGEDTVFFQATDKGTPLSWYEVMWTPPKGNAYFNLAHQYIAATLNMLAGASASAQVLDAMEEATDLFETFTSAQIGELRGNRGARPTFIELAGVLDMYNNGEGGLGPLHCDEDGTSAD